MERADADHPDAVLLIEGGEAALLQGGQQAVGGGGRKSDRLGEVGEGHAVSLGEALENRQCTIERLHLPALGCCPACPDLASRSEEHTSELQSLMRISYAVFCLKKKNN